MTVLRVEKAEKETKNTPLDEVELALGVLKIDHPGLVIGRTYLEISKSLNKIYKLNTTEEDVFILHEPTIDEMEEDLRISFAAIGLTY